MGKANSLNTPMVVKSLNGKKDPFYPREDNEEVFGPEVPYLNAIKVLMYLVNWTRPDITFATNLLVRFSSTSRQRHWNEIKHLFCYL